MKRKKIFFLCIAVSFFSFAISSCAKASAGFSDTPTISVSASSSVYVRPDTAELSFSARSLDKNLETAKAENDKIKASVSKLVQKYGIAEKNVSMNSLTIYPRYSYYNEREHFIGYEVNQEYTIRVNDLAYYEAFLTELLQSGIKTVNNVSFTVENKRAYTDAARVKALQIAGEKALLLCANAPGSKKPKLGKIMSISEFVDDAERLKFAAKNVKLEADSSDSSTNSYGQMELTARLTVLFELEY